MEAKKQHIRIEKIRLLYSHSFTPAILSGVAACFLVAALWAHANHQQLLIWFITTIFLAILRVSLILKFKHTNPQSTETLAWEAPYAISLLVVFFTWSIGLILITPLEQLPAVFIIYAFSIGLAGSAIAWHSAIRYLQLGTISLALLPIIVVLLNQHQPETFWLAIAASCLFLSCITASILLHKTLNGNLALVFELEESKRNAEIIANTDALTGLNNRRGFFKMATSSLAQCRQAEAPVSLIMLSLDLFKKINDQLGHEGGDMVLRNVADLLSSKLRAADICCRFSGKEFAILLPETNLDEAKATAQKLHAFIAAKPVFSDQKKRVSLSASFGVTSHGNSLDEMLHLAEKAIGQAKAQGGNLVEIDNPDTSSTTRNTTKSGRKRETKVRETFEH